MIQLVIQWDPNTGEINVNGPVDQEILCLGLLEKAKQAVMAHAQKKAEGARIVPALVVPMPPKLS